MGGPSSLTRAEWRLLRRLHASGAGLGGQAHPIPRFRGTERTEDRLLAHDLLVAEHDGRFYLNTPVYLKARRRWWSRAVLYGLLVTMLGFLLLAVWSPA